MRPWRFGFHHRECGAGGEIDALEIDGEHAVPFVGLDILDQGPRIDAGILHQYVEAAMRADRTSRRRVPHPLSAKCRLR